MNDLEIKIYELAKQGKGARKISKELSIGKTTAQRYLNKLGMTQGKYRNDMLTDEELINKIGSKYSKFEYIGGYENARGYIYLMCKDCGHTFRYVAQILRDSRNTNVQCKECNKINNIICGKEKKRIEAEIKKKRREQKKIEKELQKQLEKQSRIREVVCSECGQIFKTVYHNAKYCSDKCRKRIDNRYTEISRRKKLKENGKIDYSISLTKLIKRDKSICKLCGDKIDKNAYEMQGDTFIAKGTYPSIDHIIPVSKGGTHTWDNVQLAHCKCNSIKSDSSNLKIEDNQIVLAI